MNLNLMKPLLVAAMLVGFAASAQATMPSSKSTKAMQSDQKQNQAAPAALNAQVQKKLKSDQRLAKSDIKTSVDAKGNVTLNGTVKTKEQSRIAQQLVADIVGVKQIHNDLKTQVQ